MYINGEYPEVNLNRIKIQNINKFKIPGSSISENETQHPIMKRSNQGFTWYEMEQKSNCGEQLQLEQDICKIGGIWTVIR